MKNLLKHLWAAILIINVGCHNQEEQITIRGHAKNYPDSTIVVLANTNLGKPIDTTYIKNEEFIFKTPKMDTILARILVENNEVAHFNNEAITFFIEDTDILALC